MCIPLADALAEYAPSRLISSREPKASETAEIVGARLGIPIVLTDGLQENDRTGMMVTPSPVFRRRMATFFKDHGERVLGHESAEEALARFITAIAGVTAAYPEGNLAVVTHGTVIALFVAAHNHLEPFPYWQHLNDPAYVVLSLPDFHLVKTVTRITDTELEL